MLTIGNFDGVHRGHQALIRTVVERARAQGTTATALTFDPHPQELLRPGSEPRPITTMAERVAIIGSLHLDRLVIAPFTRELAEVEAEDFVVRYLLGSLGMAEIYVGSNFGFGHGKRGDVALLQRMAGEHGFHAQVVDQVTDEGTMISSTRIRQLLSQGDLEAANLELGRPYFLQGVVVAGEGRGSTIGIPTANLSCERPCLLPHGVYAVEAEAQGERFVGALNFGLRPTFDGSAPSLEVHLLDFPGGSLLDHRLRVDFHFRVRAEQRFESADALVAQIRADLDSVRRHFAGASGALP